MAFVEPPLPQPDQQQHADNEQCLHDRVQIMAKALDDYYAKSLAAIKIKLRGGYATLHDHCAILDAIVRHCVQFSFDDAPTLHNQEVLNLDNQIKRLLQRIERRIDAQQITMPQSSELEQKYFKQIFEQQEQRYQQDLAKLDELQAQQRFYAQGCLPKADIVARITVFARGGYGRAEVSLASDIDLGYCLSLNGLNSAQAKLLKLVVQRLQSVLERLPSLKIAQQYFELGKPISRHVYGQSYLDTATSILEGRYLGGHLPILQKLQQQIRDSLPYGQYLRTKYDQYLRLGEVHQLSNNIKENKGGLRSIQIALWLVGVRYTTHDFSTAALLELATKNALLDQAELRYALVAIDFLQHLRNCGYLVGTPNALNQQVLQCCFQHGQWQSIQQIERLKLLTTERLALASKLLIERLLNQTLQQQYQGFNYVVHLGNSRVLSFSPVIATSGSQTDSKTSVSSDDSDSAQSLANTNSTANTGNADAQLLSSLLSYVATYGYHLDQSVRNQLFHRLSVAKKVELPSADWIEIINAPYTESAFKELSAVGYLDSVDNFISLWEILLPELADYQYLPDLNRQLPRRDVCLAALEFWTQTMTLLRQNYAEIAELLEPEDFEVGKWALVLASLGITTKPALAALERIDYAPAMAKRIIFCLENAELPALVNRTTNYFDQSLIAIIKKADHNLVTITLLFAINRSLLKARQTETADLLQLERLFRELTYVVPRNRSHHASNISLADVNNYLERKKAELEHCAIYELLVQLSVERGLATVLYEPLQHSNEQLWKKCSAHFAEWNSLYEKLIFEAEQPRTRTKLIRLLEAHIDASTLKDLMTTDTERLNWFMQCLPNRYLFTLNARDIVLQMQRFHPHSAHPITAHIQPEADGTSSIIIHCRGLSTPHSQITWAISRAVGDNVDIIAGKINLLHNTEGELEYFYYFYVTQLPQSLDARELEQAILNTLPPQLKIAEGHEDNTVTIKFGHGEEKGYSIYKTPEGYQRHQEDYWMVHVISPDQPTLLFRLFETFAAHNFAIEQVLVTSLNGVANDYFYVTADTYHQIQQLDFAEELKKFISAPIQRHDQYTV